MNKREKGGRGYTYERERGIGWMCIHQRERERGQERCIWTRLKERNEVRSDMHGPEREGVVGEMNMQQGEEKK